MATDKTHLTELATAVGMCWRSSDGDLAATEIPGIPAGVWQPAVLPAAEAGHELAGQLGRALANGAAFRDTVLAGRRPRHLEWTGGSRNTWVTDVPGDLTVDDVYFVQAKYDGSTSILNTAPSSLFDDLLVQDGGRARTSWFSDVAPAAHRAYHRTVLAGAPFALPAEPDDLDPDHRAQLKVWMRGRESTPAPEREAYRQLCLEVSAASADRWQSAIAAATPAQRTQMLFRMLRIAGGPYWVLGDRGSQPVRLKVLHTRAWRARFDLVSVDVRAAEVGQPQVDWVARVVERASNTDRSVAGTCEVRWTHGKLQGNPECKVKIASSLDTAPGYEPMETGPVQLTLT